MDALAPDTTPAATVAPLARLYGEPMVDMPTDLYIPPDALRVFLETFEGPLDLLLYLIRRQNLDVLDIPMARLTAQYMEYVDIMRVHQLELASEYLLMAALLIEIKSRMLLPRVGAGEDDEELDPRAELVRRLIEYEQMKLAAYNLDQLSHAERDFALVQVWFDREALRRLPEVRLDDLRDAWLAIVARAKAHQHHRVTREELSVREHMSRLLRELGDQDYVLFTRLFRAEQGVPVLVVSFLAMLELAKEGLVTITQAEPYAPIHLRRRRPEDYQAPVEEDVTA